MISTVIKRLKKINTALPSMLVGIAVFGILCQIAGLLFVKDKANYSIGLWIGVLTAIFMVFHMAISLNSTVEMDEKGARAAATRKNILRYLAVIIVLEILMVTRIGNPLAAFLGIMGLKVSAYMNPLISKIFHLGKEPVSGTAEEVKTE
jgi:NADH:ubiquinone oxidoreductase subunit 2 (subunit N)